MILRDTYYNFPGRCKVCSGSALPTIDTERDIDDEGFAGVLYLCVNCVNTMAGLLGFVHPERVEDLEAELNRTAERLDEQETENADLAAQLATMVEAQTIVTKRGPGRPRKVTNGGVDA